MGGCAGKNKSKSDQVKLETRTKDKKDQSKSENLPVSNSSTVNNEKQPSNVDELNVETPDSGFDGINRAMGQIFSSHIISVSDSELEIELAKLVYGHPEHDYAENPVVATTFKSTDV